MKKRVKLMSLHQHFETENLKQESPKGAPESTQENYRALKKVRTDKLQVREQDKKESTPSNTAGSAADSSEDNLPLGLHVLGACSKQRTLLSLTKRYKGKFAMRSQAPRWPRLGHHKELARKRPCTSTVHFSGTALHTQNSLEHL